LRGRALTDAGWDGRIPTRADVHGLGVVLVHLVDDQQVEHAGVSPMRVTIEPAVVMTDV